ncbi:hypothetical protein ACH4VR_40355 [Streptomyces sp. NPDC020883]|uniref:hypothetical protein n=1 Tax=Streptomyces sp. NPDC020883 TaxID=3365099 RepID=UPI0037B60966
MTLTEDEFALLDLLVQVDRPHDLAEFFPPLNPPPGSEDEVSPARPGEIVFTPLTYDGVGADHPGIAAWTERELALHEVARRMEDKGLVRVVHPSGGAYGNLVQITEAGRVALNAAHGEPGR